jgi:hypothetical protein
MPALVLLALLLGACSNDEAAPAPSGPPAVSAPAPGVTLPPDALAALVPAPSEVPAGMVLVTKGSGPRTLEVVAGYSGTGATATAAAAKLTMHGFASAYVAQYVNPGNGQVISVVATRFATPRGAADDFLDDTKVPVGVKLSVPAFGSASYASVQDVAGGKQLVLVRFRNGAITWSLAYQATKPVTTSVAVDLARLLATRSVS